MSDLPPQLVAEGFSIEEGKTNPKKPGKKPRPVWNVWAPAKWHGLLYDLGAKKWHGLFSFWEDPTERIAKALQTAQPETYGERAEGKNQRSLARAERRRGFAGKALRRADAAFGKARRIADGIPFGQPILVGHHSEGRARRDQKRMHAGMQRGVEETRLAELHEERARGAEWRVERQESIGFMQRRVEEAKAELRRLERCLAPPTALYCPTCKLRVSIYDDPEKLDEHKPHRLRPASPDDEGIAFSPATLAAIEEQKEKIAYYNQHIAEAGGIQFKREDFAKGDLIVWEKHGLLVVLRVNAKTLSCRFPKDGVWEPKVPFAEIRKHVKAADMTPEQREFVASVLDEHAKKTPPRRKKNGTGVFTSTTGETLEAQTTNDGHMTFDAKAISLHARVVLPAEDAWNFFRALSKELGIFDVAQPQGHYVASHGTSSISFDKKGASVEFGVTDSEARVSLNLGIEPAHRLTLRGRDLLLDLKNRVRQKEAKTE